MQGAVKEFQYDLPDMQSGKRVLANAWAQVPRVLSRDEKALYRKKIKQLLKEKQAVLVAHYYVDGDIQDLAEETGGCVADSLEMARFGRDCPAETLVVAGVRFMGETAKILSPEKKILMPTLDAYCSLDLGCPVNEFSAFCDQHPDRIVVVYANTSAAVKARADWMATSSIGLEIVSHLKAQGKKIIWGPDRHLGSYIQEQTGADMLLWQGSCLVHDEFKGTELALLKQEHPSAKVLVHPEAPASVVEQADVVGSTSQILNAVKTMDADTFIIATDKGIFHKMQQVSDKTLIEAPTAGNGATCKSCAQCPWMAMSSLENLAHVLETESNEVFVEEAVRKKALTCIERMLDFSAALKKAKTKEQELTSGMGCA